MLKMLQCLNGMFDARVRGLGKKLIRKNFYGVLEMVRASTASTSRPADLGFLRTISISTNEATSMQRWASSLAQTTSCITKSEFLWALNTACPNLFKASAGRPIGKFTTTEISRVLLNDNRARCQRRSGLDGISCDVLKIPARVP
jgi:hypothetical protein